MDETPEKTLSANLTWLMANSEWSSQGKLAAKAGIDQRTVGRILNEEHLPTLDKITSLATVFKLKAWQLLAPRLGADLYMIDSERRVVAVQLNAPPADHTNIAAGRLADEKAAESAGKAGRQPRRKKG